MDKFAVRLKEIRKQKKVFQKDAAKLLDISERQYNSYEAGKVDPPTSKLLTLADYFDVSLDWLTGRSETRERQP